jgi:hypothetical protein
LGKNLASEDPCNRRVTRKAVPTTTASKQPKQVRITGSGGNLTINPPKSKRTPRQAKAQAKMPLTLIHQQR